MDNKWKIDEKSYYQKCEKYINRIQKYKQALLRKYALSNCLIVFSFSQLSFQ